LVRWSIPWKMMSKSIWIKEAKKSARNKHWEQRKNARNINNQKNARMPQVYLKVLCLCTPRDVLIMKCTFLFIIILLPLFVIYYESDIK
jgi:hypothetical protein